MCVRGSVSMHACIHACVLVCACVYACTCVSAKCVCVCVCMCACKCVCVFLAVCVFVFAHVCLCVHVCMCVHMYANVCVCVSVLACLFKRLPGTRITHCRFWMTCPQFFKDIIYWSSCTWVRHHTAPFNQTIKQNEMKDFCLDSECCSCPRVPRIRIYFPSCCFWFASTASCLTGAAVMCCCVMLCHELSSSKHVILDIHELLECALLEQCATKASAVIKSHDESWL